LRNEEEPAKKTETNQCRNRRVKREWNPGTHVKKTFQGA
jgi:hypothetical protein